MSIEEMYESYDEPDLDTLASNIGRELGGKKIIVFSVDWGAMNDFDVLEEKLGRYGVSVVKRYDLQQSILTDPHGEYRLIDRLMVHGERSLRSIAREDVKEEIERIIEENGIKYALVQDDWSKSFRSILGGIVSTLYLVKNSGIERVYTAVKRCEEGAVNFSAHSNDSRTIREYLEEERPHTYRALREGTIEVDKKKVDMGGSLELLSDVQYHGRQEHEESLESTVNLADLLDHLLIPLEQAYQEV